MRAFVTDRLPINLKIDDSSQQSVIYGGIRKYDREFLSNLLRWGTFDRYFVCQPHPLHYNCLDLPERLEVLEFDQADLIKSSDTCILYRSGTDLSPFVPYRQIIGRPELPICGVTHGLSDVADIPRYIMQSHLDLRSYDALVCTSRSAVATLHRIYDELGRSPLLSGNIKAPILEHPVIPIGVSCVPDCELLSKAASRELLDLRPDSFVVLSIGRISPVNKADLHPLLVMLPSMKASLPNLQMVIAGDDTDYGLAPTLQKIIDGNNMGSYVRLVGNLTEESKHCWLTASDVFVALSDTFTETYGISVAEALWHGLPIIASDWNGYRHLVKDGFNGFLIPTKMYSDNLGLSGLGSLFDNRAILGMSVSLDLNLLKIKLLQIAQSSELQKRLASQAHTDARQRFSWRTIIAQYESFWFWQSDQARSYIDTVHLQPYDAAYYRYDRAFTEHPSMFFDEATRVTRPERAASLFHIKKFFQDLSFPFSDDLTVEIIELVNKGTSIEEVVGKLVCKSNDIKVILHILRLLKYNLLTFADENE